MSETYTKKGELKVKPNVEDLQATQDLQSRTTHELLELQGHLLAKIELHLSLATDEELNDQDIMPGDGTRR